MHERDLDSNNEGPVHETAVIEGGMKNKAIMTRFLGAVCIAKTNNRRQRQVEYRLKHEGGDEAAPRESKSKH